MYLSPAHTECRPFRAQVFLTLFYRWLKPPVIIRIPSGDDLCHTQKSSSGLSMANPGSVSGDDGKMDEGKNTSGASGTPSECRRFALFALYCYCIINAYNVDKKILHGSHFKTPSEVQWLYCRPFKMLNI